MLFCHVTQLRPHHTFLPVHECKIVLIYTVYLRDYAWVAALSI